MRTLPLLAMVALAACGSGPQIEHVNSQDLRGRIVVRPMGEHGALPDYTVKVTRQSAGVTEVRTVAGAGALIPDLDPGHYTVRIAGRGLRGKARVTVRDGESTCVTWWLTPPPDETGISSADRVVLYILSLPFRIAWWILKAMISGGAERCRSKSSSSRSSRQAKRSPPESAKPLSPVKW